MAIYKDIFGQHYFVSLPTEVLLSSSHVKDTVYFHDDTVAQKFLRNLYVSPQEWNQVAHKLDRTSQEFRSDQDTIPFLARCLVKNRLHVAKAKISENLNESLGARSVKVGGSKTVTFLLPAELQLQGKRTSKSFVSEKSAKQYLQSLNLNKEKEEAIVKSLEKGHSSDSSQNTAVIVSALLSGELLAYESEAKVARLEPSESAVETDIPGSRPVQPPSSSEPAKASENQQNNNNQEAQAETLKKAAENEAAFCENCDAA